VNKSGQTRPFRAKFNENVVTFKCSARERLNVRRAAAALLRTICSLDGIEHDKYYVHLLGLSNDLLPILSKLFECGDIEAGREHYTIVNFTSIVR